MSSPYRWSDLLPAVFHAWCFRAMAVQGCRELESGDLGWVIPSYSRILDPSSFSVITSTTTTRCPTR